MNYHDLIMEIKNEQLILIINNKLRNTHSMVNTDGT